MNHKEPLPKTIPQKIINTYYQKFYHERKAPVFTSPISKFNSFVQNKSKSNVVFQINYQTSKRIFTDSKSSNTKILSNSISKSSLQNQTLSLNQNNDFQSQQLNPNLLVDHPSVNIPKKNITFEVNHPNKVKGSIKHIKSDSKRQSFKAANFQHFPQNYNIPKQKTKKKNSVDHFLKVNPYSKTVDLTDSFVNPQKELKYFHSNFEVSPEKDDKLFTLQNFTHIKVHNKKKNKCKSNTKDVYDVVKRKQVNLSPAQNFMQLSILMESQGNKLKLKNNQTLIQKEKIKQRRTVSSFTNHKQGLFKQFKPKIQLKRRPSTGIPIRKNRNSVVHSVLEQHHEGPCSNHQSNPNEIIASFYNTIDTQDMRKFSPSKELHSVKHSRGMTLNFNSPRGLKIHSKQIHLLKYVELSSADKIKDYFKESKDLGKKDLNNLVHLELCKKVNQGKFQRYSGKKQNNKKNEEFFQPWESINREEQIQNNQLINRQIQLEMFNKTQFF